ncbi:MAG: hypothetical protein ACRC67_12120 [Inquilinus sp.]|uniref:hypothetical protein n=1 Tax=Inquilinus sp. TaxID=1932117 RepID=UPI003F2C2EF1
MPTLVTLRFVDSRFDEANFTTEEKRELYAQMAADEVLGLFADEVVGLEISVSELN